MSSLADDLIRMADALKRNLIEFKTMGPQQDFTSLPERVRLARQKKERREYCEDIEVITGSVDTAVRFAFSPESEALVKQVADKLKANPEQVSHIKMPAGLCWFEFPWAPALEPNHKARTGYLFAGRHTTEGHVELKTPEGRLETVTEGSLQEGAIVLAHQNDKDRQVMLMNGSLYLNCEVHEFETGEKRLKGPLRVSQETLDTLVDGLDEDGALDYLDNQAFMVFAAAALLGSEKVVKTTETDYTKLNKQRVKAGKQPLRSMRVIHVDLQGQVVHRPKGADYHDEGITVHGGRRIKHFVMPFTRLRRGKVEFVRPHWRGDETIGIKKPIFTVKGED